MSTTRIRRIVVTAALTTAIALGVTAGPAMAWDEHTNDPEGYENLEWFCALLGGDFVEVSGGGRGCFLEDGSSLICYPSGDCYYTGPNTGRPQPPRVKPWAAPVQEVPTRLK
jgi:hypothetical protein